MLQNDEAFAFLPGFLVVIGIVTRGSKVAFSGRFAAFGSLSQRSRF